MAKRSSFYLPEELVFKILSSLPVKSLVRFSSVCKSWQSIISNPQFIRTHLTTFHKNQANSRAVFVRCNFLDPHVYICTPEDSTRVNLPLVRFFDYMCSCDGLVCLTTCDDGVCVWNPSIKRFKMLPSPKKHSNSFRCKLGFVFDSISNDYKLIKFTVVISDVGRVFKVEMYSSNADSWNEILVPTAVHSIMPKLESQCVHLETGVIYLDCYNELLSFDWRNEVFGVYPFPKSARFSRSRSNVLDFEGSIAMIFESIDDGSVLSLWMLDDPCGGKVSWTKKFNFEAAVKKNYISLYLDGGFVSKNGVVYDYKKKDIKEFLPHIDPSARQVLFSSVFKYTESLVSLGGFKKQE